MNKCRRCKIEILDDALSCPLCNSVLEHDADNNHFFDYSLKSENRSKSIMYPDVSTSIRRMRFVIKLVVFCSIVAEGILILINYLTYSKVKWSAICGIGLAYACFSMICSFRNNKSHRKKMMVQATFAIPVLILIDYFLGYTGWSVNFALPCVILALDVSILVLMIVNTENWQSYILLQVYCLLLCIIFTIVMFYSTLFQHSLFLAIADAFTILLLAGTLVFGDRLATTELKRRFHM